MPVTSIAFRPERKEFKHGGVILASYADGMLVHWHFVTGQKLTAIQEPDVQINVVEYSPTGHIFAAAGSESQISIYDGHTQKFKYHLISGKGDETAGHSNRIFAIAFSPVDSNCLVFEIQLNLKVTAGWDDTVQIWDIQKRQSIRSIFSPHICGDALDFDSTGERLLTGSYRRGNTLQVNLHYQLIYRYGILQRAL
jgi:COMPASS component SWD3